MALFTTATEKLTQNRTPNILILGASGVGKTFSLQSLPPEQTVMLDCESGDISIDYSTWNCERLIDVMKVSKEFGVHPFELVMAVLMLAAGGPQPAYGAEYSPEKYQQACDALGGPGLFNGAKYFVIDSLTQLDATCANYIQTVRRAEIVTKSGEVDGWKESKLHKSLMSNLVKVAQQIRDKSLILLAILDEKKNDSGFAEFKAQFKPSVYEEVKGILDVVASMIMLPNPNNNNQLEQVLVTHPDNPWRLPAKKRGNFIPDVIPIRNKPGLYGVIRAIEQGLSGPPKPMGSFEDNSTQQNSN